MTPAAPWFLAGLLAIALPVYVHLLRQHKATPLPFASLMFFERRTQSSVKHRRLKYLALLAMRIGVVTLLALTFANFYVGCAAAPSVRTKLTVLAVDRSLSMKAGRRMEEAKAQALKLAGRGPVQVIAFDSQSQLLTQATTDPAEVAAAVQSINAGDGHTSYGDVARTIRSVAEAARMPVEAHILTDAQRSGLPTPFAELALPASIKLTVHPVASARESNWYVEDVVAPRHVYQTGNVKVQATVAGAGTEARTITVALRVNGRDAATRQASVPAGGRASVEFPMPELTYGFNRGELRIDAADALAQDNTFSFAVERKEASRVLLVGNPRSVLYYRSAIESVPNAGFKVDAVSPGEAANAAWDQFALVVLADAPLGNEEKLASWVRSGGGLLVALGPGISARGRVPVSGAKVVESTYASRSGERFQTAANVDNTHPALHNVNSFEDVKFYQAIRVEPGEARMLARLSDGTPLVLEQRVGEGRVLVFASTLDNVANDLPLHASFVPFVEGSARYLSGFVAAAERFTVGSFVDLRQAGDAGTGVEVIGPDGARLLSLDEAAKARTFRLPREGFFELRRANGRNELIAAHTSRRESDLDIIPAETLTLWQNTGGAAPGDASRAPAADPGEDRRYLWRYFAIALLILAVLEPLFSSRYLSPETEPAVRRKAA